MKDETDRHATTKQQLTASEAAREADRRKLEELEVKAVPTFSRGKLNESDEGDTQMAVTIYLTDQPDSVSIGEA